ncbi:MAG: radical SAM protein [Thermoplasmata archaeon]
MAQDSRVALRGCESEKHDTGEILATDSSRKAQNRIARRIFADSATVRVAYRCTIPLIRPSKLTTRERGGIGKNLSEGWCLNFAVGCTHGCPFCYVDSIHKRFGVSRYGDDVLNRWGDYFMMPENLERAIEKTPWKRWKGAEVIMSSTHDPYLPQLADKTREILERALAAGVRFCIQTRSCLVLEDLDLLTRHRDLIRLQVSIATLNAEFARRIEPRVPPPKRRLDTIRKAKEAGLEIGVIVAPVFPPTRWNRNGWRDLRAVIRSLSAIKPHHIYGESLHARGQNLKLVEEALGERLVLPEGFDAAAERVFYEELAKHGLSGKWWPERS